MICNILCVGTELLLGQVDDTNSGFIARSLVDAGIESYEHRRVGDNAERIEKAVRELLENCDSLIVTGGLGPTHDDITRDVVAKVMGTELELDQDIATDMKKFFARRSQKMAENNLRQAMVPKGATPIINETGTAPGLICPIGDKRIYVVPGVPREMQAMITQVVIPEIVSRDTSPKAIVTRTIKIWGMSESNLGELLSEFIQEGEAGDVKVGFLARGVNGNLVKLSAAAQTSEQAQQLIAPVEERVVKLLGDLVYAYDNQTMESVVVDLLTEKGLTLAIAESLTGGMVSSRLVHAEGVSKTLKGAVVSYAKSAKNEVLGVDVKDVYSNECAEQMAIGVRKHLDTDIGISTTGVAGPGPDDGHDAGEVYVGVSVGESTRSMKYVFAGDRKQIRQYATISVLNMLRLHLQGR